MNYQIIINEQRLKDFIDWLPELEKNQKYYLALFARKKYIGDDFPSDKGQLKRFLAHKGNLIDKIKQLEIEVGSYKINNILVPQKGLVLYITPNPRDMVKATAKMAKSAIDMIVNGGNYNIHAEALSCVQQSKAKTYFMDFDIDDINVDLTPIKDILVDDSYKILRTRGGYHILVKPEMQIDKKWFINMRNTFNCDQVGDQMIPIPGCVQGNFEPHFINL